MKDLPDVGGLQDSFSGKPQEERFRFLDLVIGDAGDRDVGAGHARVSGCLDEGVEGDDVAEPALSLPDRVDVTVRRADCDINVTTVENSQRVFQAHAEL